MGMDSLSSAVLTGIITALASWLPLNPEGSLFSPLVNQTEFLVPAYLGITFAVLFRYRERFSEMLIKAMKGIYDPELKFIVFAAVFTVTVGYPLERFSCAVSDFSSLIINAGIGVFLILMALLWPKLAILKRIDEKLPEQPSILDALSGGILQGLSVLGTLARTGFVTAGLVVPGHSVKKSLEWGFMVAPAYFVFKLAMIRTWKPDGPAWVPFTAFLLAFVVSLLTMRVLETLAERNERKFLAIFGLIPILALILEVIV